MAAKRTVKPRYFISQDQSSHWYVIPTEKHTEWAAWTNLSEDDEASWTPPEWARPLNGSPTLLSFEDPQW